MLKSRKRTVKFDVTLTLRGDPGFPINMGTFISDAIEHYVNESNFANDEEDDEIHPFDEITVKETEYTTIITVTPD